MDINIILQPTQILNATLRCPKNPNLNYDLLLYEVDEKGNLGELLSASTTGTYFNKYSDGEEKTVDEGISYINSTDKTITYAIIVFATEGYSSEDSFEFTLSLDNKGNYDSAEPNDSAFEAYKIKEGELSGASLHVENDQDWYIWDATAEFKSAKFIVSAGYDVEVYTADGNKLKLNPQNPDGTFSIANDVNYVKVFSKQKVFKPSAYTLNIIPWNLTPDKMLVHLDGDQGDKSYPDYPEGEHFRFKDRLSPDIGIVSRSGYPVKNHPVTLYWESGAWNEQTGNKTRTVTGKTNKEGVVKLVLEKPDLPTSLGSHSVYLPGPIQFTHYYDIDGIVISSPGVEAYPDVVYHFAYSVYEGN